MTPRGTRGLCCVHIAQLMTHPAVYKPLGILQKVTKSQKVHMSNHVGLQKTITSTLLIQGFSRVGTE